VAPAVGKQVLRLAQDDNLFSTLSDSGGFNPASENAILLPFTVRLPLCDGDLSREEPDPALFQIPPGFKLEGR
jgi:hypothetical protein